MDASVLWFFLLTVVNISLMYFIIHRWGWFSAEGFCMAFLLALVLADTVGLYWSYFFNPEGLHLGIGEFSFRLYPTAIHIIGIFALICGLYVANPNPTPFQRPLNRQTQPRLRIDALIITIVGLIMYLIAVYLIRGYGAADYYGNLDRYRSEDLAQGGFWYRGADIMLIGLTMLVMAVRKTWTRVIIIVPITLIPILLESNKGGLEKSVITLALSAYIFQPTLFRRFLRPSVILPIFVALLLTLGLKNNLLSLFKDNRFGTVSLGDSSASDLAQSAAQSLGGRYSQDGVYRGYCMMVNYITDGYAPTYGGRVLLYTFDSWVPRLLWPTKDAHPFHGIGYMINISGRNSSHEASATSLVGYAFADFGGWGVAPILFMGGVFLGLLRRITTGPKKSHQRHLFYLFFVLFNGVSHESGFLGVIAIIFLVLIPWLPSYAIGAMMTRRHTRAFRLLGAKLVAPGMPRQIVEQIRPI